MKLLSGRHAVDRLGGGPPGKLDPRANWTSLAATRMLPQGEWPQTHVLEIVSICKSLPASLVDNHGHAFIRLIDPEGGVRSIGFFPDESTGVEPDENPGLRMPGMLLAPDKYDRIDWNPLVTRFALDAAEFNSVCAALETMQAGRLAGSLAFDILDRSCVGFVVRMAAQAGIAVEAENRLSDFWFGDSAMGGAVRMAFQTVFPKWLCKPFFNAGLALRGGLRSFQFQYWVVDGQAGPQCQTIAGLPPVFSGLGALWHTTVPFFHVRALRQWQARQRRRDGP